MVAVAVAPLPPPPTRVTVGAEVYPVPPLVIASDWTGLVADAAMVTVGTVV